MGGFLQTAVSDAPIGRAPHDVPSLRAHLLWGASDTALAFLASDMREARGQEHGMGETTAIDYYRDRFSIYTKLSAGWSM